jgi:predicted transcriptional regulator
MTSEHDRLQIRKRRKALGMGIAELSRISGVSYPTVAAVERGIVAGQPYRRGPNRSTVETIKRALDAAEKAQKSSD